MPTTLGRALGRRTPERIALLILCTVLAGLAVQAPARADHDDGIYEIPSFAMHEDAQLSVLIVPPNHGQIYNFETGVLNGNDPDELTPFNTYLDAIEDSIQAWDTAIEKLGSAALDASYRADVYVLGRDEVPPEVLSDPDILVITDESNGFSLGVAVRLRPCIVNMSKIFLISFTYADMYNVTAQEYGHCLGLQHVGSQGGVDPTSEQKHPEHDVMNGFYTHLVGDEGTHLHCISNLDIAALELAMGASHRGLLATGGPRAVTYMPVEAYGDTCEPPPADWRTRTVATGELGSPSTEDRQQGDAVITTIESPAHGSKVARRDLTSISGSASGPNDSATVYVAVARLLGEDRCSWWVADERSSRTGPCSEPVWNEAAGDSSWQLALPRKFQSGRYQAMSIGRTGSEAELCCEAGRNLVGFRIK